MIHNDTTARQWPAAMVNITNRCNLRCRHCFVFRDDNPTDIKREMDTETMGNDVDCDLCGSWVVFNIAARIERTWRRS